MTVRTEVPGNLVSPRFSGKICGERKKIDRQWRRAYICSPLLARAIRAGQRLGTTLRNRGTRKGRKAWEIKDRSR